MLCADAPGMVCRTAGSSQLSGGVAAERAGALVCVPASPHGSLVLLKVTVHCCWLALARFKYLPLPTAALTSLLLLLPTYTTQPKRSLVYTAAEQHPLQMLECQLVPRRCRMLPVAMDYLGIIPAALEQVLQEAEARGEPKPKMLYTVPTGGVPAAVAGSAVMFAAVAADAASAAAGSAAAAVALPATVVCLAACRRGCGCSACCRCEWALGCLPDVPFIHICCLPSSPL